jgi:replication-associated recombination protein RarA
MNVNPVLAFNQSRSFNIHELDAASNNSVDDIRNLIDQVRIPPQIGKYSIYIIDEVHMLSASGIQCFPENPGGATCSCRFHPCYHRKT